MNFKQLTFAREFRGYTQTDLSNSIPGLSQSNLSKFEKGFGVLSDELQNKIIEFLHFPKEFFDRKINIDIANPNYRKKTTINRADIHLFESKCKLIGYIVDEFSDTIEWPSFKLSAMNVEDGFTPQYVAYYNRKLLKLHNNEPVKNIISLVESSGILVFEVDVIEKIDGLSFFTDRGVPLIIINKNSTNDRKRFTIAHELGHLLLHNENHFPVSSFRNKEQEANDFASEFLMPEASIKISLRSLKINDLDTLKSYWLTSMAAIIRRAKDLKCIDENRYKYFLIEMSRLGYTKKEPSEVFIDKPTYLRKAYKLFEEELSYSIDDFVNFTALPKEIIDDIFNSDKVIKLKIVK